MKLKRAIDEFIRKRICGGNAGVETAWIGEGSVKAAVAVLGHIAFFVSVFLVFWLYLAATPEQSSAINDLEGDCAVSMEDAP